MGDERRRFSRITFHRPAALERSGVSTACEVVDLSLKGANVEVPADFAGAAGEGCALVVHLGPAGPFIRMDGTIVHREGRRVGVRCDGIDLDGITHLRRFVELNVGDEALLHRELGALVASRPG
jgi:hypothetical protein